MFEVRIHGRGGQGVVTAVEMLSVAAFLEGKHAQALPSFGSERTGSPVHAFYHLSDKENLRPRADQNPDALTCRIRRCSGTRRDPGSVARLPHRQHRRQPQGDHLEAIAAQTARPCDDRSGDRTCAETRRTPGTEHGAARRLRGERRRVTLVAFRPFPTEALRRRGRGRATSS
jgi:hypothetical protein